MDAHALLYRSHFGFSGQRLANASGEDTSISYGFLNTVLRLLEIQQPPTHFAVVMDHHGKTFRQVAALLIIGVPSHHRIACTRTSTRCRCHVRGRAACVCWVIACKFARWPRHSSHAGFVGRHELYSDYKAQRPPMPDAMKLAIPKIQVLLEVWAADQGMASFPHSLLGDALFTSPQSPCASTLIGNFIW